MLHALSVNDDVLVLLSVLILYEIHMICICHPIIL